MLTDGLFRVLVDRMLWFIRPYAGSRYKSGKVIPLAVARYRKANKCRSKPWPVRDKMESQSLRLPREEDRSKAPNTVGTILTQKWDKGLFYPCTHASSSA